MAKSTKSLKSLRKIKSNVEFIEKTHRSKRKTLTYEERQQLVIQQLGKFEYERYLELFNKFDRDGSGSLEAEELAEMLKEIGMDVLVDDIADIIDEFDEDKNGYIDFDEFVKIFITFNQASQSESSDHSSTDRRMEEKPDTNIFDGREIF